MELPSPPAGTVLLIDDDRSTIQLVVAALETHRNNSFQLEVAHDLVQGTRYLQTIEITAILLNFGLSGSRGLGALRQILAVAPQVPIIVFGGAEREALAAEAIELGAQDCLLSEHLDSFSLSRSLRNAIQRTNIENKLYAEREMASVTLNSIGDAVLSTDVAGNVNYLNVVAERMTGWTRTEAHGLPLTDVFHIVNAITREPVANPMQKAMQENRTVGLTDNCVLIRKDGTEFAIEDSASPIHNRTGAKIGAVIVFHDVTDARAMSIKMAHSAHHDPLTNLPNRLLLSDRISQAIALSHRKRTPFAVMYLDLDHFKAVNDGFGHSVGDKLLQAVSQRLLGTLRASDTISRQGGDEFVILLPGTVDAKDAAKSAEKLLLAVNTPYTINGKTFQINCSIGTAMYPQHGEDADTLLHNADLAMYHAKEAGRNSIHFFTNDMNLRAIERQVLESHLHLALERNEFRMHYQPKVSLETSQITGAEALIRWQTPDRGLLPPAHFINIAESCGLIVQIGRWAMFEACRQTVGWHLKGHPALTVAVNVSAIEFADKHFVDGVRKILLETGLAPRHLQIELTEGVLMENIEASTSVLRDLKAIGVQLAVDDFGTGYSSLSYLRDFPIDILKIDRSFVQQIGSNPGDSILVSAIIGMGRNLKYLVVAEGIETQQQKAYLQSQCCAEGQGFLFSHPVDAPAFAKVLEAEADQQACAYAS